MSIYLVSRPRLSVALVQVRTELRELGFWNTPLEGIHVRLVTVGWAFGWQYYGTTGDIHVPILSLSRLLHFFGGPGCSLRDLLRHEYAHALADTHRGLIRSRAFSDAFGAAHEASVTWAYDAYHHVSPYAASSPMEDFAETFMHYVKHRGRLPRPFNTEPIRRKWRFLRRLAVHARRGQRRFESANLK